MISTCRQKGQARRALPLHAYRLVYPDSPHPSELLWEWEQPFIDRLLWTAKTFGRQVVQRYFVDWHALAEENQRLWAASYWLCPADAPWEGWQKWMAEYRMLIATVQEVYEAQYGQKREDHS
jgi:hypothetical protein